MKSILKSLYITIVILLDRFALTPHRLDIWGINEKGTVKFSALLTGIKGKVGGTVFQGSKTGFTIKNKPNGNYVKSIPTIIMNEASVQNWEGDMSVLMDLEPGDTAPDGSAKHIPDPKSPQTIIRSLSKRWGSLTVDQRSAWTASAINFPFLNRFGEPYTGSGYQVFMSINAKLIYYGQAIQNLPPSPSDGELATWPWDTINITADPFPILHIPDGICANAMVVTNFMQPMSAGKLKVAFGGAPASSTHTGPKSASSQTAGWHKREVNGFYPKAGATINYLIEVINLLNGHIVYSSQGSFIVPISDEDNKFRLGLAGFTPIEIPGPFEPVLDPAFVPNNLAVDCGEPLVDHSSGNFYIIIAGMQLNPNEIITLTQAGPNPANFFLATGTGATPLISGSTMQADASGAIASFPLWCEFTPDNPGAFSSTLTISGTSFTPAVITFSGTGV